MSTGLNIHRIFEIVNGNKGKIGPHEGKVAALMLSGEKPVCNLSFPYEREQIKPLYEAAKRGEMKMFISPNYQTDDFGNRHTPYYFCQNGKEADMQRLFELFEGNEEIDSYEQWAERSQEIGTILGYSQDDIDIFLKWNSSLMLQGLVKYLDIKSKLFPETPEPPDCDFTPLD
jgi:hypothetical protein